MAGGSLQDVANVYAQPSPMNIRLSKGNADVKICIADKREFLRISQAVGMGFLIMGVIGYVVKLSM